MFQKKLFRKTLRLFPKYKDIILRIRNIRIRLDRLGGIVVEMMTRKHALHGVKVRMDMDLQKIPVVEPRPLQVLVIDGKAQWLHQVQHQMLCCAESGNVPRISRNFRFYQYDMHRFRFLCM